MMLSRHALSDEAYIDQQRRSLQYRKPAGLFLILISCLVGAYGLWIWVNHNPRDIIGRDPSARTVFEIGTTMGSLAAFAQLVIIANLITGLSLIFGGRGTRLLIKYHDNLKERENAHTP